MSRTSVAVKPFATLAEKFPGARFHEEWRLLAWHPEGVIDDQRADQVVEFLEHEERSGAAPFHRYTDMTGFTRIQLGLDHVFTLGRRRKRGYKGARVKSAFFAIRLISLSIGRMYQEVMHGAAIEVRVFRDRAVAAHWLGVPEGILLPPKPGEP
jgi:hypothetical protein